MEKNAHLPKNPFIYEGYAGPDYFCDRTEETEKVIAHLQNGRNVTLVSPRKIGKTGLIQHVFHQIKAQNKNAICIYTDIFHTQNQHDMVQTLGRAIVQESLADASSISKTLNTLKDKDLIYQTPNGYIIYDRFFSLWLQRTF